MQAFSGRNYHAYGTPHTFKFVMHTVDAQNTTGSSLLKLTVLTRKRGHDI